VLIDTSKIEDINLPRDPYFYLRAASGPIARAVMAQYDRLGKRDRRALPIEAFVVAAAADPNTIADLIAASLAAVQRRMVAVKFSAAHSTVADLTLANAALPGKEGFRDRESVHKIMGALPIPKGAQTIVNVQQNAVPQAATVLAPPPEQTIRRLSERLAAARPALPVRATPVPDDEETEDVQQT
jgi:hypothetical protein